jgi:chromosome segregation ATPase
MNDRRLKRDTAVAIGIIESLATKIEELESIIEDYKEQVESLENRLGESQDRCYELEGQITDYNSGL